MSLLATEEELQRALDVLNQHYDKDVELVLYTPKPLPKRGLPMTPTTPFWKYQQSAAADLESNTINISPKYMSVHLLAHEYTHILESSPKHNEAFLRTLKQVRKVLGIHKPRQGPVHSRIVREKEGYYFDE